MCYYYPLYKIVNYYYYYYRGAIEFSHSNTYSSLCEKVFYLVLRYYDENKERKQQLTIKLILQTIFYIVCFFSVCRESWVANFEVATRVNT